MAGAGTKLGAVRRMTPGEDDTLRRSVEALAAENARLRDELAAALAAGRLPARPGASEAAGASLRAPARDIDWSHADMEVVKRDRRRWMGRAIGVLLLVFGFAAGVLVASRDGSVMNRAFRAGYEDGAAAAARAAAEPAPPAPPPAPPAP